MGNVAFELFQTMQFTSTALWTIGAIPGFMKPNKTLHLQMQGFS